MPIYDAVIAPGVMPGDCIYDDAGTWRLAIAPEIPTGIYQGNNTVLLSNDTYEVENSFSFTVKVATTTVGPVTDSLIISTEVGDITIPIEAVIKGTNFINFPSINSLLRKIVFSQYRKDLE